MNDDEFSGVVSSGKHHSVSVSERTGDAKTPHNFVTSNEKETFKKAHSFEGREGEFDPLAHNVSEDQNLLSDTIVTEPYKDTNSQITPAHISQVENLQSVKQEPSQTNYQSLPKNSTTLPDNHQSIASDTQTDWQQGVAINKLENKLLGIQADHLDDNIQGVAGDYLENNNQSIPNPILDSTKAEAIAKDPIHINDSGIAKENIQELAAHIDKDHDKDHDKANIDIDGQADNNPTFDNAPISYNLASINKEKSLETDQTADKDSFEDRGATVSKDPQQDNLQATESETPISENFQPIDDKPLNNHFEALPIDARSLDNSAPHTNNPIANNAAYTPLHTVVSNAEAAPTAPIVNPQKIAPSRAISLAEAKKMALAHQVKMAAFHSRLVDIKHNVEEIKHKLDDVENKS